MICDCLKSGISIHWGIYERKPFGQKMPFLDEVFLLLSVDLFKHLDSSRNREGI